MSPSSRAASSAGWDAGVAQGNSHHWNARHGARELPVFNISAGLEAEPFLCPSSAGTELQHVWERCWNLPSCECVNGATGQEWVPGIQATQTSSSHHRGATQCHNFTTNPQIYPLLNLPVFISCVNIQESIYIKRFRACKEPSESSWIWFGPQWPWLTHGHWGWSGHNKHTQTPQQDYGTAVPRATWKHGEVVRWIGAQPLKVLFYSNPDNLKLNLPNGGRITECVKHCCCLGAAGQVVRVFGTCVCLQRRFVSSWKRWFGRNHHWYKVIIDGGQRCCRD